MQIFFKENLQKIKILYIRLIFDIIFGIFLSFCLLKRFFSAILRITFHTKKGCVI